MKRGIILSVLVIMAFLVLAGCMFGSSAEEIVMGESSSEPEEEAAPGPSAEDLAEELIGKVEAEAEAPPAPEPNITEENLTEENITRISGDLSLQDDLALCPHLQPEFLCDKEDVRWCDIGHIVSAQEFYPDYMVCKDGDGTKGQKKGFRYCLILDCSPVSVENIVTQYGTYVAFAEYRYTTAKTGTGIMNTYTLTRCGEEEKGFETVNECRYYGSRIGKP